MIEFRGYAVPFRQAEPFGNRLEFVQDGAFDRFLSGGSARSVFLNFATHDAAPIGRAVSLRADAYGLRFSAFVAQREWLSIRTAVLCDSYFFCSVFFSTIQHEQLQIDGLQYSAIIQGSIEHITITADPVYTGSGIWPAEADGPLPPHLANLATHWNAGERAGARRHADAGHRDTAVPKLNGSRAFYAQLRAHWSNELVRGGDGRGEMIGHVCFSKVGGFGS